MEITVDVSNDTERTHAPYWLIIDPKATSIFQRVTGLFFSRDEADHFLKMNAFDYSDKAQVWCFSGNRGRTYREAYEKSQKNGNCLTCKSC